jgi:hypothetical protein
MKLEFTEEEFKSKYKKLTAALAIQDTDVNNYSIFKGQDEIQIMVGDWSLTLNKNGKWDIH